MKGKTIAKVLRELLCKTREKKKETEDENLERTSCSSALWAIVVALRGPDDVELGFDYNLKELTTGRIRGILRLEDECVTVHYDSLTDEEITRRNDLLNKHKKSEFVFDHFADHFRDAMRGLKTLGYDVPEKELSF